MIKYDTMCLDFGCLLSLSNCNITLETENLRIQSCHGAGGPKSQSL